MGKSKTKGENHVRNVYAALMDYLQMNESNSYPKSVVETVKYIVSRYSNIKNVQMKYDFENPDFESDLKLTFENNEVINVNLFSLDRAGKIQPKNPGANSFLKTYFNLPILQEAFNKYREVEYKDFLRQVISTKEKVFLYDDTKILKQQVHKLYPKFNEVINPIRKLFLFKLREYLFELLNSQIESVKEHVDEAFITLLLLNDVTIITSNANSENVVVEQWKPDINFDAPIEIYRKGNDTVGIRKGKHALTLRVKFESAPSKSLKLATSYDLFPEEDTIQQINFQSLKKFQQVTAKNYPEPNKVNPNAIGKCNEALIYSAIVEKFPTIYQVDETEYIKMYTQHAPLVKDETRNYLINSAKTGLIAINNYLTNKYSSFVLDSIHLVPNSYVKDKLDTTDLKLTLKVEGKRIDEDFSLKAITKRGATLTIKNPGVGTILGPLYFNCGSTEEIVSVTKSSYLAGQLNHMESLEAVSHYIGEQLKNADQQQLLKGLQAMIGSATTVVTFYLQQESDYYERHTVNGEIEVLPSNPTPINTKLTWNEGKEHITLRVKFSGGQSRGWTSLKLVAGYVVK